jgi:hypothetical protein
MSYSAIPLLVIDSKELKARTWRDMWIPMSIAAFSIEAKM